MALAAYPFLHAAAMVPTNTVLHATATGLPVFTATDTILHTAVSPSAVVLFPTTSMAMDASIANAVSIIPFFSFATDLYNTIASYTTAANILIPFSALSTATTITALTATATSITVIFLVFSTVTFFHSWFFRTISSAFKGFPDRFKHLVFS